MTEKHFVVVDGSNLATEGRKTPSLGQLDEAVRAYTAEDPQAEIVVVVDASFEHRIDPKEAAQLEQAMLHGEVVAPPAGAIGRGDAFVLRIAERTGAAVLSNDSFQEFHDEHPWLFDDHRLIGGKPVPGVGWIFTPRIPVRGAKSRQSERKGKGRSGRRAAVEISPEERAAELAKAAKRAAERIVVRNGDGTMPRVGDVWVPQSERDDADASPAKEPKARKKKDAKKEEAAVAPAKAAKATKATKAAKATKETATKAVKAKAKEKAPAVDKAVKAPAAAKKAAAKATKATKTATAAKTTKAAAKKTATKVTAAKKAAPAKKVAKASATTAKSTKAPAKKTPSNRRVRAAIVEATAEALSPEPDTKPAKAKQERAAASTTKRKRRRAEPPPAVNEPMAFIEFVAAYPMGGQVTGDVASFTSHGAMIEVQVPGGGEVYCYVPLAGLADPPPVKARDVLTRGESRTFVLVGLDPARRVAELSLPDLVDAPPAKARAAGRR